MSAFKVSGLHCQALGGDIRGLPLARIADFNVGIVGPPNRTCGSVINLETNKKKTTIVWDDDCRQVVSTDSTELQFFTPSEISSDKINLEWANLLKKCRGRASNVPPGSFVLMTGFPGSGKSTLSKVLASELGMLHFDFAAFAKQIIGRNPLCQEDYVRVGSKAEVLIADYMKCGGSVIYDTTAIDDVIRRHHFGAIPLSSARILVWVPTDSHVCHQRLISHRPLESPDLRPLLMRKCSAHVRTFHDFVSEFVEPCSAIRVSNYPDVGDACLSIKGSLKGQF